MGHGGGADDMGIGDNGVGNGLRSSAPVASFSPLFGTLSAHFGLNYFDTS